MTFVYDVTASGVRNQQRLVLKKAGLTNREELSEAVKYVSALTMATVAKVCETASAIMAWIKACGARIVATGEDIRWTTPIGFPVVQPYRRFSAVTITTHAGKLQDLRDVGDIPVSVRRQLNGVAPNIIHSFDKCHMFNKALACQEAGVWFAAVHDCDRTHGGTRDEMDTIIREEFVALHQRPLLDDLLAEWRRIYPGIDFPEPPPRGDFDIRQVLNARYFFS